MTITIFDWIVLGLTILGIGIWAGATMYSNRNHTEYKSWVWFAFCIGFVGAIVLAIRITLIQT